MIRYLILFAALVMALGNASCKKSKSAGVYSVTVKTVQDSTWSTNTVTTEVIGNNTVISALNNTTKASLSLAIFQFQSTTNNDIYEIINSGTGTNASMSNADYNSSNLGVVAIAGSITVTTVTNTSIIGTFTFHDYATVISGSFVAPLP